MWRLTGHPAEVLGVVGRGRIEPGFHADLVAFDPDRVGTGAAERVHDLPGRGRPPGRPERGHRAHVGQRRRDLARRRRGPRRGRGTAPAERGDPGMSRRDEILEVAKAQIAERGYGNTSMRDIAEASGLLAGSLYSHFRSKAEIVRDIVIRFYDELLPAQQAVIDGDGHGCRQVPRHGRCGPRGLQPAPRGADDPALRLAHALRSRCAVRRARAEPADARPLEGGDRGGQGRRLDPLRPSTPRRWSASPPARSTR